MCDQANHDNCEIVDELHLEITNLEMTIADLKSEIVVKREKIEFWRTELLNKTDEVLKSMREVLGID